VRVRSSVIAGLFLSTLLSCSAPIEKPQATRGKQATDIPSPAKLEAAYGRQSCKVQLWEDGDTPTVLCGTDEIVVRMIGMDTAESGFDDNSRRRGKRQVDLWDMTLKQVFACGKAATHRVRALCPVGSPVDVIGGERDKYGRLLAYVICRGINLNQRLVKEGLAGRYAYPAPPEAPSACPLLP